MPTAGSIRYLEALPPPGTHERPAGTLVLLHAFPLNARMWEPQLGLAARGWHVVAPHARGMDGAIDHTPVTSIDDYVADLIDLLDALHVKQAVIGGLSMGGYLAFGLLRHAAHYVRGLILADTKADGDTPDGLAARKQMLALIEKRGVTAVADEIIPKLLGETTRRDEPEIVERVRELTTSNSAEAIAGSVRALMSRPDSTPILKTIRVPTLIVVGDEDVVTPVSAAEALHARIAGSELVKIERSGHLSSLEQTAAFNEAVGRFLDRRV